MKVLTLGGLFEGIGGFPLAATWAGIKPIWSNEIDPWCCKVLRKNFNHEIIEKDIRHISAKAGCERWEQRANKGIQSKSTKPIRQNIGNICTKGRGLYNLPKVDILTGGFPCQPFSHAGKRKGTDDNRYLWPEYLRLIRELRPSWIVAENVAGLISMENGKTLEGILDDLENENYQTEVYNIPACGVGAWHKRERLWIVSHSRHARQERGIKKGLQGGRKSFSKFASCDLQSGEIREDVSDTISGGQQRQRKYEQSISPAKVEDRKTNFFEPISGPDIWSIEPRVGRVANGIPGRVDRLKGLGNAIVPQVAYEIFKAIVDYEQNK